MKELSEQLKEIIDNKIELSLTGNYKSVYIDGVDKCIDEITALINDNYVSKEFVQWLASKLENKTIWRNPNNTFERFEWDYEYTLDELFEYWKTEIRDK